eukprot:gnl/TRDRNA2_/TRDRNA2_172945_c0_seq1.p1 gnl/TRDRNA2_/TRDRNA2_172945_c0~~gnl/TRDRNA2_/TRDRNA2_172945_c0_seq1.p1  ORF type:complete len:376 (-),score=-0.98 gnl/TRDRNA2_/TRDRNA2_172945_c0_seq1:14-1141(-)
MLQDTSVFILSVSVVQALRIQTHEPKPLDEMIKDQVIREGRKVCITKINGPRPYRNTWFTPNDTKHPPANYIPGTTFWWNEIPVIGHVPLVVPSFLGVAHATLLDRVVWERVVPRDSTKCWESWLSGFFQSVQGSSQSNFSVYLRYRQDPKVWHPYLRTGVDLTVSPTMCFDHVFQPPYEIVGEKWRPDTIRKSFTPEVRHRFLTVVHQQTKAETNPHGVLVSLRNKSRNISNAMELVGALNSSLKGEPVRVWWQSDHTSFAEQVKLVAGSRIVIAVHGAFETNIMWLDPRGLWVELRGMYMKLGTDGLKKAAENYEALADSFGVHLQVVPVDDLRAHRQHGFQLHKSEIDQIVQIASAPQETLQRRVKITMHGH